MNDGIKVGDVIVETNGNEFPRLHFNGSCGESYVTPEELECTFNQVHTSVRFYI